MTKQRRTSLSWTTALGAGLLTLLVAGSWGYASTVTERSRSVGDGELGWLDVLEPEAPGIPGGFRIEDGEEDPPDFRAHSDVPDLPDSSGSEDTEASSGPQLYTPPPPPNVTDTIYPEGGDAFEDSLVSPEQPFVRALNDPGVVPPSGVDSIPGPATVLLFGAAGLGTARRRRR